MAATQRLKLTLAYDGTDFHGWQEQAGECTVAGELRGCLERILDHPVTLVGVAVLLMAVAAAAAVLPARRATRVDPVEVLKSD